MSDKQKHLQFIQDAISRMARNSFLLKGWTVTLVSTIIVLGYNKGDPQLGLFMIALVPVLLFWILDGFFLWQEKLFQHKYDYVRELKDSQIDYNMNPQEFKKEASWVDTILSKTLLLFYLSLAFICIIFYLIPLFNLFQRFF